MPKKLNLTRDQIAGFVGDDPRSVKQLEKLITEMQSTIVNQATATANTIASARAELEDLKQQIANAGAATAQVGRVLSQLEELDDRIQAAKRREAFVADQAFHRIGLDARAALAQEAADAALARPRTIVPPKRYGMFFRYTDAAPAGAAVNTITWEDPEPNLIGQTIKNGIRLGATAQSIICADAGIYNIEISAQFKCTELGGTDVVQLWIDTPSAASGFQMNSRAETFTGGSATYYEYKHISFSVKGSIGVGVPIVAQWRCAAGITSLANNIAGPFVQYIPAVMLSITKDS